MRAVRDTALGDAAHTENAEDRMRDFTYEYHESREIAAQDYSFYSLVMAAMRKADNKNERLLRVAFPDVWEALREKYYEPGALRAQVDGMG